MRSLADEVPFDIPDSWEWVRIRSLGEIVRGSGIKRNETVRQGFPCVRYGELYTTYQTSFTKTVSFIAPDLYEKCKHFSYGDVLMTLTGENKPDIAKAVAYLGTEPIAAGGDLAFWTQHGMDPLYLSYIMASPYIIGRKMALATGDIIVHISGDKLGTIAAQRWIAKAATTVNNPQKYWIAFVLVYLASISVFSAVTMKE